MSKFNTLEEATDDLLKREPIRLSAWDAVNKPMARQFCEVLGIDNPRYWEGEAIPVSMLYSWTKEGYRGANPEGPVPDYLKQAVNEFTPFGYNGKMAVTIEHKYLREPRIGEMLHRTARIESISPLKKTKVGEGYFITELSETYAGDEKIGEIRTALFSFKPGDDDRPDSVKSDQLPSKTEKLFFTLPVTTSFVIASAIVTRDYEDVHHDIVKARQGGAEDIYVNILATIGLFQRCVEERVGNDTRITGLKTNILSSAYPGDTLHLVETGREQGEISIAAMLDNGIHASGTVYFDE